MELFDYLKCLTESKEDLDFTSDEISKNYSAYTINRFVSMVEIYIPIVAQCNRYDLPKHIHYSFYKNILPKKKQYFNYLKKKKDVDLEDKKYIAEYFEISLKEADEYCSMLDEKTIKEIRKVFIYGKNKTIEV